MKKQGKQAILFVMLFVLLISLVGCSGKSTQKVVIYTNADKEAVQAMQATLNTSGYEGKYVLQTLGTSELGGKMIAEGSKIEADLITMSSYFIESAQQKHKMFTDLSFTTNAMQKHPSYYAPILANTGAIFVNTQMLKEKNLPMPQTIKDLTKSEYKGLVSIPNIMNSSTAWLLIQAIISEYGETEGKAVLAKLIANCGPHIEKSGSGPIKKVRVGEVAVGFGLRHQAVADKAAGKPMDFIDPQEGNYSLTEGIAVVKKADADRMKLAMEMAKVIITKARKDLIKEYPVPLYNGETVDSLNKPGKPKVFIAPLTVELLEKHQAFFKAAQ